MSKYIALLRGINVGGRSVIRMTDLKRMFEAAGCQQVSTFIQSGNVLFEAPKKKIAATVRNVQRRLRARLGDAATALFRSGAEFDALAKRDLFKGIEAGANVKLYVTFLSRKPSRKPKPPLLAPKEGLEVFQMKNLEVFVVSRKVKGRFGFPNNLVEKELGVAATTRNWTTVSRIAELARADSGD